MSQSWIKILKSQNKFACFFSRGYNALVVKGIKFPLPPFTVKPGKGFLEMSNILNIFAP